MRDRLAHRYFDTSHAIVAATVTNDLPLLEAASAGWPSTSPRLEICLRATSPQEPFSAAHICLSMETSP